MTWRTPRRRRSSRSAAANGRRRRSSIRKCVRASGGNQTRCTIMIVRWTALMVTGILVAGSTLALGPDKKGSSKVPPALQFEMKDIDGKNVDLGRYKGKVILIVNVASECGYTPQYKELQALYAKHKKDGLAILGFPCNDFGGQEPGDDAKVKDFACSTYKVEF